MITVDLGELDPAAAAAWHGLIDVSEILPQGWAVAGGQMVYLHCAQRATFPERPSDDGDVVVDVRTHGYALRDFVAALKHVGFRSAGSTPQGYQHRWVRDDAQIEVLIDGRRGVVHRPDLMGALSSKAAAFKEILVEEAKDRHLIDVLTLAGFVSRRELSGREPWEKLEKHRVANAIGAIRCRPDIQARFDDSDERLDLLVLALRYFGE